MQKAPHAIAEKPTSRRKALPRRLPSPPHAFGEQAMPPTYSQEEIDFMLAMDLYKREKRRPFPTWSEVLAVVKSLGYRKSGAAELP